jgi:predicted RNA binding protein YcfA (HicA-like mRNA interferase family)
MWVRPTVLASIVVAGKESRDVPVGTLKSIVGQIEKDSR